jgi:6,7-dimethyl-8-ribityllumazine synthase
MNIIEGNLRLNGDEKVAIICGRFNHIITDRLVEGAEDSFKRHGGDTNKLDLILVPGAFEIPFALQKALESGKYDAVCCVGSDNSIGTKSLVAPAPSFTLNV